ncbi:MAG: GIY-YIG nuclease family protein [Patescibacteria group bacterium]
MFAVYILQSEKTGRYYIGYTSNLDKRIRYHNSRKNKSTKSGIPWRLIKYENFDTKKEAWLRERKIKYYKSGEAFKKLVQTGDKAVGWPSGLRQRSCPA